MTRFVIAVHNLLMRAGADHAVVTAAERDLLRAAVLQIVNGCADGTRYGIRQDTDGLLAAGEPGVQLTWMDARVGDRVITPRIGKPVEVQALWLNALWIAAGIDSRWRASFEDGRGFRAALLEPAACMPARRGRRRSHCRDG